MYFSWLMTDLRLPFTLHINFIISPCPAISQIHFLGVELSKGKTLWKNTLQKHMTHSLKSLWSVEWKTNYCYFASISYVLIVPRCVTQRTALRPMRQKAHLRQTHLEYTTAARTISITVYSSNELFINLRHIQWYSTFPNLNARVTHVIILNTKQTYTIS